MQVAPRPVRQAVGDEPAQPALAGALPGTQPIVALTRAGWANPAGLQRPGLQRVAYFLENGTLRREYWNVLDPTLSSTTTKRDLLTHVKTVTVRYLDAVPAVAGPVAAATATAVRSSGCASVRSRWRSPSTPRTGARSCASSRSPDEKRRVARAPSTVARRAPQRQRGIALLVAILLVALGTIIAAAVAYENAMTARRGTATFAFDESLLVAQGAEALAAYGLRSCGRTTEISMHLPRPGLGQARSVRSRSCPGVMLQASLEDLQGRFNLNNLVNDRRHAPMRCRSRPSSSCWRARGSRPSGPATWSTGSTGTSTPSIPDGAEDSVYMGQTPPYRTAQPLHHERQRAAGAAGVRARPLCASSRRT